MQRKMMNYAPETGWGAGQPVRLGEVLFEFSAVGNSVKVCAVDTDTLVEATIFGPVSAGEAALRHAALQKLRYVLKKKQAETDANNPTKRLYA
jgi:hypothetical protein